MSRLTQRSALWIAMAVSALFTWSLWGKVNSLLVGDVAWWMQCVARYAQGELPYRDFQWQYPPLTLYLFGGATRMLGQKVWIPQVLLVVLSLAIVVLLWDYLRSLLRPPILMAALVATIATGATSQTFFSLFSLMSYSPALHLAMIGMLLVLRGFDLFSQEHRLAGTYLVVGSWIALLAKQECWLAVPVLFVLLLLRDWLAGGKCIGRILAIGFVGAALPAAVLFQLAQAAGWDNFRAAMQGYGLATITCPWWPTGIGLWGMAAAIGLGCFVVFASTCFKPVAAISYLGRRTYWSFAAVALLGGTIFLAYIFRQVQGVWFVDSSLMNKLRESALVAFSVTSVWRPAIWGGLAGLVWFSIRLWRTRVFDRLEWAAFALFVLLVTIASRGLFGSTINDLPEVPALAYPLVIPVSALLLGPVVTRLTSQRIAELVLLVLLLGYGLLRVAGGWPGLLSDRDFARLDSPAGPLLVKNAEEHRTVLNFVLRYTQPGDTILELPEGGGIAYLTGRRVVGHSTMFHQMPTPPAYQQLDLQWVRNRPPKVVIGKNAPHLGSYWGTHGALVCPFPALVWSAQEPAWDSNYVYPVVEFLEQNYKEVERTENWVLMLPSA